MINAATMLNLPTGPSGTTAAAHHAPAGEAGGTLADAADPSGASFAKAMKKAQAEKPQAADAAAVDDTAGSPNIDAGSTLPALVLPPLQNAPPAQALVFAGRSNQAQLLDEGSADSATDGMVDSGQNSALSPTHPAIDAGQARRRSLPLSASAGLSGPRTTLADAAAAGAPVSGRVDSDKSTIPRHTDPVQPDTGHGSPQRLTPQTLAPIVPQNGVPVDPALDAQLDPLQGDPANSDARAAGGAIPLRASVQPGLLAFGNGPARIPMPGEVDNTVPDPKPAAAAVPVPVSGPAPTIWPLAPERNSNRPVPRQAADAVEPGTRRTAAGTRSLVPAAATTATAPSPWQTAVTAAASAAARDAAATHAGDSTNARAAPAKLGSQDPTLTALSLPGMNAGGGMSVSGQPGTIAQASIRAPVGSEAFATQTGYQVAVFARAGVERAELQLNPADMGPVTVQIVMEGTTAMVHLSAHHADTRSALETAMPQLASSLRDAGLTLTGGGVFEQPRQPQDGGAGDNNKPGGRAPQPGPDSASTQPLGGQTATSWLRPRGVVDLVA